MAQYIDKDALVAEINRVLNSYDPNEITSGRYALVNLRDFLDTLEVKEVDIEKEYEEYVIDDPIFGRFITNDTMKSYTDLEQSKKLAEFLPLESADHHYVRRTCDYMGNSVDGKWSEPKYGNPNSKHAIYFVQNFTSYEKLSCWSLAALLGVLPIVYTNNKKEICGPLHIDITDSETPFALWYVNPLHKGGIVELKTKECDNLVDACYEMIIKLHELKML